MHVEPRQLLLLQLLGNRFRKLLDYTDRVFQRGYEMIRIKNIAKITAGEKKAPLVKISGWCNTIMIGSYIASSD
jgi:hypothetical protein